MSADAETDGRLDELVVTATRRETSVQDTPASISVFNAETMRSSQIDDLRNIALYTPGLSVGGYAALGVNPVSIRGIGQNPTGVGADDAVAIYRDGVYLGRGYADIFDFGDTDRVEVLKGPQGTLYGRNATGGAINIISHQPGDAFEATAETRLGNLGERMVRGLVGGPVDDKVSLQLSASNRHLDGYVFNRFDGTEGSGQNATTLRGQIVLTPTDDLKIALSADSNRFTIGLDPKLLTDPDTNLRHVNVNYDGLERRRSWGFSATIDYDFDWARLTSITAYREADFQDWADQDGTPANILLIDPLEERQNQVSEEVRLASSGPAEVTWLAGLSYFGEHAHSFTFYPYETGFGLTTLNLIARNVTDSYAAFADATWTPVDNLRLTAGGRYTYEHKDFTFAQVAGGIPVFTTIPQSKSNLSDSAFTPRLTADYRWSPEILTYVSISRGFKSGGFAAYNYLPAGATSQPSFAPEDVWAYEAGVKSEFLDRRVRIDLSLFHYDYSNLQVRIPDQFGFVAVKNAATAQIDGAELEAAMKPTPETDITVNVGRLLARYSRFIYTLGTATIDNSGKNLIRAPHWKGAATAQYRIDVEDVGSFTPRVEYTFEGRSFYDDTNGPVNSHGWVNLYNARLTFEDAGKHWTAALYGLNLADRLYNAYSADVLGSPIGFANQPRTFGVDVRYSW